MNSMKWCLVIGVMIMAAGVANAAVVALDDFSSGDESGGTGWGTDWMDYAGAPMTMSFSSADPFEGNISTQYRSDGEAYWNTPSQPSAYVKRTLATALLPSTTPEVWVGVYLRPTIFGDPASAWQYGFEVGEGTGAQAGAMSADDTTVLLARGGAANQVGDGTSVFTLGQETLLMMRLYKNDPGDTVYNRADLIADLDGRGIGSEVTIYTGLDLAGASASEISVIQLYQDGYAVDFDYVAVGTTKADVPEPTTIALLGLGGSALLRRKKRR